MRIALLTDGIYPYVIGGMQKHSFNLAKYFAKNKIFVDLYHTNQSKYDISKLEFFTEEEKKHIRSFVINFPSCGATPGHYIRESFDYSERIFKLFSVNRDVDFIYAKGFTAWKLIDEKRKGFKCPPVGVNFHGYEMFQKAPSLRSKLEQVLLLRKPVLFNIQNADFVFSYGGIITELVQKLGIDRKKIIESPAGIEREWVASGIRETETTKKFLFVGRYERRKGIQEINLTLKNIYKNYTFEFHFVGNIEKRHRLSLPQVKYWGEITERSKLIEIISNCDVLVCPSYAEGMPNVILEAMSAGLSVIATNVGAVNILVGPNTGWLINPGKASELKNAMIEVINMNNHDLNEFKQNAIGYVRNNFLIDEIMDNLIKTISLCK